MIGCCYNSLGLCLLMVSQGDLWSSGTQLHLSRLFQTPRPCSQACRCSVNQYFSRLMSRIFPDHPCGCSYHHLIYTALRCTLPLVPFFITVILFVCLTLLSHSEVLPECDEQLLVWPTQMRVRRWQVNTSAVTPARRCHMSPLHTTWHWCVYQNWTRCIKLKRKYLRYMHL